MKAAEITDALLEQLASGRWRHLRLNYANADMVGHTGHRDASVIAVETVDLQLGRLLPVIEQLEGALIVTADHCNADCMFNIDPKTGKPSVQTSHTLNAVPFHVFAPGHSLRMRSSPKGAGLANVAATLLQLLGYAAPEDYHASVLED